MVELVSDPSQIVPQERLSKQDIAKILASWQPSQWKSIQDVGIKDGEVQFLIDDGATSPFSLFDWLSDHGAEGINPFNAIELAQAGKKLLETPMVPNPINDDVDDTPVESTPPEVDTDSSDADDLQVVDEPVTDDDSKTSFFDDSTGEDAPSPVISAKLSSSQGSVIEVFDGKPILVGRAVGKVQAVLDDHHISRVHAKLQVADGHLIVNDVGSVNGTYINGEKLQSFKNYIADDGDVVSFWKYPYKVSYER